MVRAARRLSELPLDLPSESDQANPEVLMSHQERAHTIARAMEKLPPKQRLVVELTYYQDCSPKEIAARIEVSVSTVRSRLRLAHCRLACMLTELRETTAQSRKADKHTVLHTEAICSSGAEMISGAARTTPPQRGQPTPM